MPYCAGAKYDPNLGSEASLEWCTEGALCPLLNLKDQQKKITETKNGQSITVSPSGIKILTMAM